MTNNRRIFISSLVTVVAAGTLGVSFAQANFGSNMRRGDTISMIHDNHGYKNRLITRNPGDGLAGQNADFAAITAAQHMRHNGDHGAACRILEDAGIESPESQKRNTKRCTTKSAIENGSWEEYQKAVASTKMASVIDSEEKFNSLVEAHELRAQGRYKEARDIMRELHQR
jgi:hypothetical protein